MQRPANTEIINTLDTQSIDNEISGGDERRKIFRQKWW